jgi:thiamine-phosphate diphosphorylase
MGPLIHLITDRRRLCPAAHTEREVLAAIERLAADAIEAGVTAIQIRERDLDARTLAALTRTVVGLASGTSTTVLVNDRVDVAVAAGAGGVHLRADSLSIRQARTLGPGDWLVGRSVHEPDDVRAHQDADYLVFGTMFGTRSKPGRAGHGPGVLAEAVRASRVPILAIGGVTEATMESCARAGAAGAAAIGVFLPEGTEPGARGVRAAVRALREAFDRGRSGVK